MGPQLDPQSRLSCYRPFRILRQDFPGRAKDSRHAAG